MRIVILTSSFLPTVGGLQYELKWFLDNLDRRLGTGESIEAYFVYPNERSELYTRFANIAACDLKLENLGKVAVARMLIRLGAFLRRTKPDVVHCHGLLPDGLWVLAASRALPSANQNRRDLTWTGHCESASVGLWCAYRIGAVIRQICGQARRHARAAQ